MDAKTTNNILVKINIEKTNIKNNQNFNITEPIRVVKSTSQSTYCISQKEEYVTILSNLRIDTFGNEDSFEEEIQNIKTKQNTIYLSKDLEENVEEEEDFKLRNFDSHWTIASCQADVKDIKNLSVKPFFMKRDLFG